MLHGETQQVESTSQGTSTMDQTTYVALKKSIKKWKQNCKAESALRVTTGCTDCALCSLFYPPNVLASQACKGCPVYLRSKEPVCDGTPYAAVSRHRAQWMRAINDGPRLGQTALINLHKEKCLEACRQEVDFLCSLLPLDHKDYVAFDLDSYLAST